MQGRPMAGRANTCVTGSEWPESTWEGKPADEDDQRKAQFLVAIHILYFVGSLPPLFIQHFVSDTKPEQLNEVEHMAGLMRWASLAFYPSNLALFRLTGHLRLAVLLFLLYSQAVLLWLCEGGSAQGTEHFCFILFAVASVHVVGKTLGMLLVVVITLEVAMLETRTVHACPEPRTTDTQLHTSVLRLSHLLCTCFTSLLYEHLHGDATRRLQKCMDQRMKFFALISHDLRAPLQSIRFMASDLLQQRQKLSPEVRAVVDVVHESSDHLLGLLNNLLDLSRVELGSLDLRVKHFDFVHLLYRLLRSARVNAEKKGVELRASISLRHRWRNGDPIRLRQVIDNLLNNAIKFTGENGLVAINIAEGDLEPDRIRVEVVDSGVGINPVEAAGLFKSFSQVGSEEEHSHGFGLGLAICKKICQAMDGHIDVESELHKGSKFSFEVKLPVCDKPSSEIEGEDSDEAGDSTGEVREEEEEEDDDDEDEHEPVPRAGTSDEAGSGATDGVKRESEQQLRGKRVLLIDDSNLLQLTLKRMLTQLGCVVDTAWNGSEALKVLSERKRQAMAQGEAEVNELPFDLILCDVHMPGLDGYRTAQAIRQWEATLGLENERNESGEVFLHERDAREEEEGDVSTEGLLERTLTEAKCQMPIIGMSATALNGEESKCLASGMDDFLLKPPRKEILQQCLERWASPHKQPLSVVM